MTPEVSVDASSSRNKKKVTRALNIIGEFEGISHDALDEYSKIFTSSTSMVNSHAQALAALLGWTVPAEEVLEQELA
jgi:hypothetical protein